VIMVVVDGRRPGYSVGMTNFELAQTLVRLGAVTGSALDAGGSSTLAFDGRLLNRPSDPGGERAVSTSLQLMYYGVYAPNVTPVISPNGDRVDDTQRALSYKVVRPSNVTVILRAPDGTAAFEETGAKTPATYEVPFPPQPDAEPAEGRWQLTVDSTDDLGRASRAVQTFTVNNTLGRASLSRRTLVVRKGGKATISGGVTLTRAARVVVTVETASGVRISTLGVRAAQPGRFRATWTGIVKRTPVYGGMYRFRFRARNALGVVELVSQPFRVIRGAPVKKKPAQPGS